jgi:hypothetical protein
MRRLMITPTIAPATTTITTAPIEIQTAIPVVPDVSWDASVFVDSITAGDKNLEGCKTCDNCGAEAGTIFEKWSAESSKTCVPKPSAVGRLKLGARKDESFQGNDHSGFSDSTNARDSVGVAIGVTDGVAVAGGVGVGIGVESMK